MVATAGDHGDARRDASVGLSFVSAKQVTFCRIRSIGLGRMQRTNVFGDRTLGPAEYSDEAKSTRNAVLGTKHIRQPTSNQTRIPAELKHIIKRRKRN